MTLTATDIVVQCENVLGWTPDPSKPLWQARSIEASKILRRLKREKATLDDLALAVEYSRKKREPVVSPLSLFGRVEAAKEASYETHALTDLSTDVQAAISWEMAQPEPDKEWLGRLVRSHGMVREETLHGWKAAGRG